MIDFSNLIIIWFALEKILLNSKWSLIILLERSTSLSKIIPVTKILIERIKTDKSDLSHFQKKFSFKFRRDILPPPEPSEARFCGYLHKTYFKTASFTATNLFDRLAFISIIFVICYLQELTLPNLRSACLTIPVNNCKQRDHRYCSAAFLSNRTPTAVFRWHFFLEGSVHLIRDWLSENRIISLVIRGEFLKGILSPKIIIFKGDIIIQTIILQGVEIWIR